MSDHKVLTIRIPLSDAVKLEAIARASRHSVAEEVREAITTRIEEASRAPEVTAKLAEEAKIIGELVSTRKR
ncbi:MAG: hypothetical protein ACRD2A_02910 [Vicinamibacterales bacterium]